SATTFTDELGQATTYRHFDPFGKPMNGDWRMLTPSRLIYNQKEEFPFDELKLPTRRGFTDHEHLDSVELIHMNGRVYDYNVGRFMSVDPVIQSPGNSQGVNPYSYIMNNPLAGTDPTGYVIEIIIRCGGNEPGCADNLPESSDPTNGNGNQRNRNDKSSKPSSKGSGDSPNNSPAPSNGSQKPGERGAPGAKDNTDILGQNSRGSGGGGGASNDKEDKRNRSGSLFESLDNAASEAGQFAGWLVNHANQQISQDQGWRGTAWNFFAADGLNAYSQLTGGDYSGAVFSIAMALMKPVKAASRFLDSNQYSVLFETKLSKGMFPGRSDKAHFQDANKQLHEQMRGDSEFADMMEGLHPGITKGLQPGPRGAYPRRAPAKDVTWHHGVNPGQMQLVFRNQHSAPGAVQNTLHPGGIGGMNTWGGGR
ncbi:MAG: RHS repeat-associated protein, partial [Phenylobacterium sp.]